MIEPFSLSGVSGHCVPGTKMYLIPLGVDKTPKAHYTPGGLAEVQDSKQGRKGKAVSQDDESRCHEATAASEPGHAGREGCHGDPGLSGHPLHFSKHSSLHKSVGEDCGLLSSGQQNLSRG